VPPLHATEPPAHVTVPPLQLTVVDPRSHYIDCGILEDSTGSSTD